MGYVRQHHNLATTGKLGQKSSGSGGESTVKNDKGPSGASDSHRGSGKMPTHKRGK